MAPVPPNRGRRRSEKARIILTTAGILSVVCETGDLVVFVVEGGG